MQRIVLVGSMIFALVVGLGVYVREAKPEQRAQPDVTISKVTLTLPNVGNAGLRVSQEDKAAVATVTPRLTAKTWSPGLVDQTNGSMVMAAVLVVLAIGVVAAGRFFDTRRNI